MKKLLSRQISAMALASATMATAVASFADDELVLYAFVDGSSATGYSVRLDNADEQTIGASGFVKFDLSGGSHSIQLLQGGNVVHSFRFNSADGQLADVNVALVSGSEPQVNVDTYFETESAVDRARAAKGQLSGRVTSGVSPVVDATIMVNGDEIVGSTDSTGRYLVELPRGVYDFTVTHPDYGTRDLNAVRIVSSVERGRNVSLSTLNNEQAAVEEVFVVAKFNPAEFGESERYSNLVVDTMGLEELARFGDADIAASVTRVPSVTVQDSKYVFIRGLGGRYVSTTLNGANMPSTDPSKRTVPLDLFPSNIVSSLDVKKTFGAAMPGESTGGNVAINTRTFPDEASGKLSISLGYSPSLTGDDIFVDPSDGDWDWTGWDDGTREEYIGVRAVSAALEFDEYYDEYTRVYLGELAGEWLMHDLDLKTQNANPDLSLSLNYGDVFDFDDYELGFFVAANYKNNWDSRDEGVNRTYDNVGDVADDFTFVQHSNNIDASGLLSLGLNWGDSSYQANTVIARSTESSVKVSDGFDGDALENSYRYSISWVERQFASQQFTGEHLIDEEGRWTADWQFTISQATRLAPDRREIRFDQSGTDGLYQLEVPNILRRYDELVDDNLDGSFNVQYAFDGTERMESSLAFGASLITRERDSDSDSYGFTGGQFVIDDRAPNRRVSDVLTEDNITGDTDTGYTFQNKTLPSDSYDAEMDLNSVYASYDMLIDSTYQFVFGVRYEDYEQTTETFSLAGEQEAVKSLVEDGIVLPSLTFNWLYSEDQQLRFAVSKTVSRPDFKETSNATFYDNEFDFRVRGNPNLIVSEVTNFDVRWENYWTESESISVAFFYKDIENPIERVVQAASGTAGNSRTFENSESAEIYGIEIDTRKEFSLNEELSKSIFVAVNSSYIESEVSLANGGTRALQGQPEYTFNFIVGYDDFDNNQELTFLVNQNGESIKDVGVSGLPDVIEDPRLDVKLNYKYSFTDDLTLKIKLSNLLDDEVVFSQGGEVFQGYKKGREFQAGVDWSF